MFLSNRSKTIAAALVAAAILSVPAICSGILVGFSGGDFKSLFALLVTLFSWRLLFVLISKKMQEDKDLGDPKHARKLLCEDRYPRSNFVPQLYTKVDRDTDKVVLTPYGKCFNDLMDAEAKANDTAELLAVYYRLANVAEEMLIEAAAPDDVTPGYKNMVESYKDTLREASLQYSILELKYADGDKGGLE